MTLQGLTVVGQLGQNFPCGCWTDVAVVVEPSGQYSLVVGHDFALQLRKNA